MLLLLDAQESKGMDELTLDDILIEVVDVEVSNTQIFRKLESIENTLILITQRLNNLESPRDKEKLEIDFSGLPALPLQSVTAILDIEELLKLPEIAKQMVSNLFYFIYCLH